MPSLISIIIPTFNEGENEENASDNHEPAVHQNSLPSAASEEIQEHQSDAGAQSDPGNPENPEVEPSNSDPESLQNINSTDHWPSGMQGVVRSVLHACLVQAVTEMAHLCLKF